MPPRSPTPSASRPSAVTPSRQARTYFGATRAPRYSLLFAFPLLVLYEILAFALSHDAYAGVRNGADVLLKSLFVWVGGRHGLLLFGAVLLGVGLTLVIRDWRRHGGVKAPWFLGMLGETVAYAMAFGMVTSFLTSVVIGRATLAMNLQQEFGLATQLMISLGAGIYEELLFRVILVGSLVALFRRLGLGNVPAGIAATLIGALIFAAFHYVGPYGDPLELGSFAFRTVAGILFSGLYLLRGFGITAWTHALYDVLITLR